MKMDVITDEVKYDDNLIDYLNKIEEKANNILDISDPMCYVYNTNKRKTITLDISQWDKIKALATGQLPR